MKQQKKKAAAAVAAAYKLPPIGAAAVAATSTCHLREKTKQIIEQQQHMRQEQRGKHLKVNKFLVNALIKTQTGRTRGGRGPWGGGGGRNNDWQQQQVAGNNSSNGDTDAVDGDGNEDSIASVLARLLTATTVAGRLTRREREKGEERERERGEDEANEEQHDRALEYGEYYGYHG